MLATKFNQKITDIQEWLSAWSGARKHKDTDNFLSR
jgi:hypothetical protein